MHVTRLLKKSKIASKSSIMKISKVTKYAGKYLMKCHLDDNKSLLGPREPSMRSKTSLKQGHWD